MPIIRAVLVAAALVASAFASTASGAQPEVVPVDETHVAVLTDLCAFPVTVEASLVGQLRVHFDAAGNVVSLQVQAVETDTLSANGNTLVGMPYRALDRVTFDAEGNVTGEKVSGFIERIRLPDGTMFQSTGRVRPDITAGGGFTAVPTVGHSGDVDALCAALA